MVAERVGVLLVEDDEVAGAALVRILHAAGYAVTWARSVAAGVAALTPGLRLMLLDLMLPDGYGWDVLAAARGRALPLRTLVLTGAGDDVVEQVFLHHPSAVLRKPVDADAVLRWMADLAGRGPAEPPPAGPTPPGAPG